MPICVQQEKCICNLRLTFTPIKVFTWVSVGHEITKQDKKRKLREYMNKKGHVLLRLSVSGTLRHYSYSIHAVGDFDYDKSLSSRLEFQLTLYQNWRAWFTSIHELFSGRRDCPGSLKLSNVFPKVRHCRHIQPRWEIKAATAHVL